MSSEVVYALTASIFLTAPTCLSMERDRSRTTNMSMFSVLLSAGASPATARRSDRMTTAGFRHLMTDLLEGRFCCL